MRNQEQDILMRYLHGGATSTVMGIPTLQKNYVSKHRS